MICCESKNDFCRKLGARLIRAKGKTHPGSSEIGRSLRKIQKNNSEGSRDKTGVVPSFPFSVSVVSSQKNPISALRK
jgi:hypothetical protein